MTSQTGDGVSVLIVDWKKTMFLPKDCSQSNVIQFVD